MSISDKVIGRLIEEARQRGIVEKEAAGLRQALSAAEYNLKCTESTLKKLREDVQELRAKVGDPSLRELHEAATGFVRSVSSLIDQSRKRNRSAHELTVPRGRLLKALEAAGKHCDLIPF